MDASAADDFYLRTLAGPAVDVHGIAGGSPLLQKTVLPVEAEANVSIRLAPGQDVEEIAAAFERLGHRGGGRSAGRGHCPAAPTVADEPLQVGRAPTQHLAGRGDNGTVTAGTETTWHDLLSFR